MNRNGLSRKTNVPFVTPTFILELGDKTRFHVGRLCSSFLGALKKKPDKFVLKINESDSKELTLMTTRISLR